MAALLTYCLFCYSGKESKIMEHLERKDLLLFSPQVVRWKREKSGIVKRLCRLLPGYIFFESGREPDWQEIKKLPGVLRILDYADGTCALRGGDVEFVHWLKSFGGTIEVSLALQIGSKINFVDGPLKEMNGRVVKVNKKRRVVAVQFGGENNFFRTIWCPIEYVQATSSTACGIEQIHFQSVRNREINSPCTL